jgi:enamine deaminase RidA (YjgF/YER057c/UK114 family)
MSAVILNPETLPAPIGFNHGVVLEGSRHLFIAGQIGLGDRGSPGDLLAQFERALASVREVVTAAGGVIANIGRLTIYVRSMRDYLECREEIGAVYRQVFGRHFPAMTLIEVSAFVDREVEVEIEATALLP